MTYNPATQQKVVRILRSMVKPNARLIIKALVAYGPCTVYFLVQKTRRAQPTVSTTLALLVKNGIIEAPKRKGGDYALKIDTLNEIEMLCHQIIDHAEGNMKGRGKSILFVTPKTSNDAS